VTTVIDWPVLAFEAVVTFLLLALLAYLLKR
jgi:hypothetical protein